MDAIGLRDEDRRERHVHHRSIKVEAVAQRQHEPRNAARHAEPVKLFEHLGQRRLARRGREGDHHRLADVADQRPDALAKEHRADRQQDRPEQDKAEVEIAQQAHIGAKDVEATCGHHVGQCAEHREGGKAHDVAGDLQHHLGQRFGAANQRSALFADGGERHAGEQREHQNLQDVVGRHRLEGVLREHREDEFGRGEVLDLTHCLGRSRRIGDRRAHARLQQIDHDKAKPDRDQAGGNEPGQRPHPDPAKRRTVTHMGNPDDDG